MTRSVEAGEPSVFVGPGGSSIAGRNAVLLGKTAEFHCRDQEGALSLKLVTAGAARWTTRDADLAVLDDSYLILDAGQRYAVTIDSHRPVETLTVWFRPGFVEAAAQASTTPAARLLDDPEAPGPPPVRFLARLHRQDDPVGRALLALRRGIVARDFSETELGDRFHALAALLVDLGRGAQGAATRISAVRASTRDELARRLFRARDFAASSFASPVSTEDMAKVACLSTHHFHRLFAEAFGETPHQFLVRRRLDRARRLLADTDRPIGDICFEVGLSSFGSFSTLFRRSFGVSPRQYRLGDRAISRNEEEPSRAGA